MHISCLSLLIESVNKFYKTSTGFNNGKDISEVKNLETSKWEINKFLLETIFVAEYFFKKIKFEIRVSENFFKNATFKEC